MANGKFGAYKAQRVHQGDITNDLLNREDQQFRYRQERRIDEDRTYARLQAERQEQERKSKEEQAEIDNLQVGRSGYNNYDEMVIDFLDGEGGVFDQWSEVNEAIKNGDTSTKLKFKKASLEKIISDIKDTKEKLIAKGQGVVQGLQSGELSPELNKTWKSDFDSFFKDVSLRLTQNENGSLMLQYDGYDPEGDGIPNMFSPQDIDNPDIFGGNKKLFKPDSWMESKKGDYGILEEKQDENGYWQTHIKGFDPKNVGILKRDIDQLFGSDLVDLTDEGKSFVSDTLHGDYRKLTETEFDRMKDEFANQFIASYNRQEFRTKDHSAQTAAVNAQTSKKNADTARINAEANLTRAQKSSKGDDPDALATTVQGILRGQDRYLQILNGKRQGLEGSRYVENVGYDKDTGEIVYDVTDNKDNSYETKRISTANEEEAVGKILSLLRPKDDPDEVLDLYKRGKVTEDFPVRKPRARVSEVSAIMDEMPDKKSPAIAFLKSKGITGFKTATWGRKSIVGPDGTKYDLSNEDDREALKKYIIKTLPEESTPVAENESSDKETLDW